MAYGEYINIKIVTFNDIFKFWVNVDSFTKTKIRAYWIIMYIYILYIMYVYYLFSF